MIFFTTLNDEAALYALAATLILLSTLMFAWTFYRRQNGPRAYVGGPISKSKALWLAHGIGSWFLFPFVFVLHPEVSEPLKIVLVIHLVSWWIRGPIELVMIYKWFNWTPVYGITHDIVHIMTVFLTSSWAVATIGVAPFSTPMNALSFSYVAAIIFSTVAEILFAALFIATRGQKDHLIYFADETLRYQLINRFTASVCAVVYGHLAALVVLMSLFS